MRIKYGSAPTRLVLVMLVGFGGVAESPLAFSQGLSINSGSISIRALAERQRRLEEAEFLNSLNPSRPVSPLSPVAPSSPVAPVAPTASPMNFMPGDNSGVEILPPMGFSPAPTPAPPPAPVQEFSPANKVLSVYGPEGKLTAEVSAKRGAVQQYQVGSNWEGNRVIGISREGVTILRGGKTRMVPVGGRL